MTGGAIAPATDIETTAALAVMALPTVGTAAVGTLPRIGTLASQDNGPTTRCRFPTDTFRKAFTTAGSKWDPAQRAISSRPSTGVAAAL